MTWTEDPPTAPGWFWLCPSKMPTGFEDSLDCVQVCEFEGGELKMFWTEESGWIHPDAVPGWFGALWNGPIETPPRPSGPSSSQFNGPV